MILRWTHWMAVPAALGVCALAITIACGKTLPPEESADAALTNEGGLLTEAGVVSCDSLECGGLTGRCGEVATCGLSIKCGACTAPATCTGGKCSCTKATCATIQAQCGQGFSDGCGEKFDCPPCDQGKHCQSIDGGPFICDKTECVPNPDTCANNTKCGTIKNNCAQDVGCTCVAGLLCGGSGTTGLCGCGLPLTAIAEWERTDPDLVHCYGADTACEGIHSGFGQRGTPFKTHPSALPGLAKLRRCFLNDKAGITYLTTEPNCPFGAEVGDIGYCATKEGECGSKALLRFRHSSNNDRMYTTTSLPPTAAFTDYVADPPGNNVVCYVWP